MPQNSTKKYFLVSDYFSCKNGPIDLVRGWFSSLDIGTYILPTCRPSSTSMGPFGGAKMPQNSINTHFLAVFDHFFSRMGVLIWLGAHFQERTLKHTSRPLASLCAPFWVQLGMPKCPKTAQKTYFLVALGHFFLISFLISLGAYFQAKTLWHTSCLPAGLCVPFRVHFGVPKCPKTA
jgi:hypothetical protein